MLLSRFKVKEVKKKVFFCCYSSLIDPAATSCANHYSAGRTSNGEYYIKVSGVTFKVSVSSTVLVLLWLYYLWLYWESLTGVLIVVRLHLNTFAMIRICNLFVNLRKRAGDRAIMNLSRGDKI